MFEMLIYASNGASGLTNTHRTDSSCEKGMRWPCLRIWVKLPCDSSSQVPLAGAAAPLQAQTMPSGGSMPEVFGRERSGSKKR